MKIGIIATEGANCGTLIKYLLEKTSHEVVLIESKDDIEAEKIDVVACDKEDAKIAVLGGGCITMHGFEEVVRAAEIKECNSIPRQSKRDRKDEWKRNRNLHHRRR